MKQASYGTASFAGVPFFYRSTNLSGGKNSAIHLYPNSKKNGKRIEDLGSKDPTFQVRAMVDNGRDFNAMQRLIKALDNGAGTLIHPDYGRRNVFAASYSVATDVEKKGIAEFDITFEEGVTDIFVVESVPKKGLFDSLREKFFGDNDSALSRTFNAVRGGLDNINAATQSMRNLAADMRIVAGVIQGSANDISAFVSSINELAASATQLVSAPSRLANQLRSTFGGFTQLFSGNALVTSLLRLLNIEVGEEVPNQESSIMQERASNNKVVQDYLRINALFEIYATASDLEFNNIDELQQLRVKLEIAFRSLNTDYPLYSEVKTLRLEANRIFDQVSLSLARVQTINVKPIPTLVLSYMLYASIDQDEQIVALNKVFDPKEISGTIKVLSQ